MKNRYSLSAIHIYLRIFALTRNSEQISALATAIGLQTTVIQNRLFFFLMLFVFAGCDTNKATFFKEFEQDKWLTWDTLRFSADVKQGDTLAIQGTYKSTYDFQNIYIRLWHKTPTGKWKDTILLDTLSNNMGEWRVKGKAPYTIPFAKSLALPSEVGNYQFKSVQYMRKDTLKGVKKIAFFVK